MGTTTIQVATNVICPNCNKKLCKIRTLDTGSLIEFKHKGSRVSFVDGIVDCMGCDKRYVVNAYRGLVEELDSGR